MFRRFMMLVLACGCLASSANAAELTKMQFYKQQGGRTAIIAIFNGMPEEAAVVIGGIATVAVAKLEEGQQNARLVDTQKLSAEEFEKEFGVNNPMHAAQCRVYWVDVPFIPNFEKLAFDHGMATAKQWSLVTQKQVSVIKATKYADIVKTIVVSQDSIAKDPKVTAKVDAESNGVFLEITVTLSGGNSGFAKQL